MVDDTQKRKQLQSIERQKQSENQRKWVREKKAEWRVNTF